MSALVNREPHPVPGRGAPIDLHLAARDFAGSANQLARAEAALTQLSAVSARQASRDLGALLDALTQVRDTPDLSDLLDCAARELCGTGVFDRVMVSPAL